MPASDPPRPVPSRPTLSLPERTASLMQMLCVILAIVGVGITVGVYGVVALIVKMDDIGRRLAERSSERAQNIVGASPMWKHRRQHTAASTRPRQANREGL